MSAATIRIASLTAQSRSASHVRARKVDRSVFVTTLPDHEGAEACAEASAERQRSVSPLTHADHVKRTDIDLLIAQLITGQTTATAGIVARARTSEEPILLVAAALIVPTATQLTAPDLLARARTCAASTRDRQLVAIATAHLAGDSDGVDALAREHLVD